MGKGQINTSQDLTGSYDYLDANLPLQLPSTSTIVDDIADIYTAALPSPPSAEIGYRLIPRDGRFASSLDELHFYDSIGDEFDDLGAAPSDEDQRYESIWHENCPEQFRFLYEQQSDDTPHAPLPLGLRFSPSFRVNSYLLWAQKPVDERLPLSVVAGRLAHLTKALFDTSNSPQTLTPEVAQLYGDTLLELLDGSDIDFTSGSWPADLKVTKLKLDRARAQQQVKKNLERLAQAKSKIAKAQSEQKATLAKSEDLTQSYPGLFNIWSRLILDTDQDIDDHYVEMMRQLDALEHWQTEVDEQAVTLAQDVDRSVQNVIWLDYQLLVAQNASDEQVDAYLRKLAERPNFIPASLQQKVEQSCLAYAKTLPKGSVERNLQNGLYTQALGATIDDYNDRARTFVDRLKLFDLEVPQGMNPRSVMNYQDLLTPPAFEQGSISPPAYWDPSALTAEDYQNLYAVVIDRLGLYEMPDQTHPLYDRLPQVAKSPPNGYRAVPLFPPEKDTSVDEKHIGDANNWVLIADNHDSVLVEPAASKLHSTTYTYPVAGVESLVGDPIQHWSSMARCLDQMPEVRQVKDLANQIAPKFTPVVALLKQLSDPDVTKSEAMVNDLKSRCNELFKEYKGVRSKLRKSLGRYNKTFGHLERLSLKWGTGPQQAKVLKTQEQLLAIKDFVDQRCVEQLNDAIQSKSFSADTLDKWFLETGLPIAGAVAVGLLAMMALGPVALAGVGTLEASAGSAALVLTESALIVASTETTALQFMTSMALLTGGSMLGSEYATDVSGFLGVMVPDTYLGDYDIRSRSFKTAFGDISGEQYIGALSYQATTQFVTSSGFGYAGKTLGQLLSALSQSNHVWLRQLASWGDRSTNLTEKLFFRTGALSPTLTGFLRQFAIEYVEELGESAAGSIHPIFGWLLSLSNTTHVNMHPSITLEAQYVQDGGLYQNYAFSDSSRREVFRQIQNQYGHLPDVVLHESQDGTLSVTLGGQDQQLVHLTFSPSSLPFSLRQRLPVSHKPGAAHQYANDRLRLGSVDSSGNATLRFGSDIDQVASEFDKIGFKLCQLYDDGKQTYLVFVASDVTIRVTVNQDDLATLASIDQYLKDRENQDTETNPAIVRNATVTSSIHDTRDQAMITARQRTQSSGAEHSYLKTPDGWLVLPGSRDNLAATGLFEEEASAAEREFFGIHLDKGGHYHPPNQSPLPSVEDDLRLVAYEAAYQKTTIRFGTGGWIQDNGQPVDLTIVATYHDDNTVTLDLEYPAELWSRYAREIRAMERPGGPLEQLENEVNQDIVEQNDSKIINETQREAAVRSATEVPEITGLIDLETIEANIPREVRAGLLPRTVLEILNGNFCEIEETAYVVDLGPDMRDRLAVVSSSDLERQLAHNRGSRPLLKVTATGYGLPSGCLDDIGELGGPILLKHLQQNYAGRLFLRGSSNLAPLGDANDPNYGNQVYQRLQVYSQSSRQDHVRLAIAVNDLIEQAAFVYRRIQNPDIVYTTSTDLAGDSELVSGFNDNLTYKDLFPSTAWQLAYNQTSRVFVCSGSPPNSKTIELKVSSNGEIETRGELATITPPIRVVRFNPATQEIPSRDQIASKIRSLDPVQLNHVLLAMAENGWTYRVDDLSAAETIDLAKFDRDFGSFLDRGFHERVIESVFRLYQSGDRYGVRSAHLVLHYAGDLTRVEQKLTELPSTSAKVEVHHEISARAETIDPSTVWGKLDRGHFTEGESYIFYLDPENAGQKAKVNYCREENAYATFLGNPRLVPVAKYTAQKKAERRSLTSAEEDAVVRRYQKREREARGEPVQYDPSSNAYIENLLEGCLAPYKHLLELDRLELVNWQIGDQLIQHAVIPTKSEIAGSDKPMWLTVPLGDYKSEYPFWHSRTSPFRFEPLSSPPYLSGSVMSEIEIAALETVKQTATTEKGRKEAARMQQFQRELLARGYRYGPSMFLGTVSITSIHADTELFFGHDLAVPHIFGPTPDFATTWSCLDPNARQAIYESWDPEIFIRSLALRITNEITRTENWIEGNRMPFIDDWNAVPDEAKDAALRYLDESYEIQGRGFPPSQLWATLVQNQNP